MNDNEIERFWSKIKQEITSGLIEMVVMSLNGTLTVMKLLCMTN